MLREEVLREWKGLSQRLKKDQEFAKFLATQSFEESVLPLFPLGINSCRQNLDSWTSPNYQVKLSQHKSAFIAQQNQLESSGSISEHLTLLALVYSDKIDLFQDLTQGWKKEKDSYARFKQNDSNSGPTLEEVDDW